VLAALLIPLLACPPTSIPARGQPGGHVPVSLHDAPHELQPTSVAPRSLPTPNQRLPLWDLDASLAEVEARLALNEPPSWVPWISWVLMDLSEHKSGSRRLLDALASSELSAEHLAWWRSITPDPTIPLRMALDRSKVDRTRALLTATLALTEYARSCPVPVEVDGACRAPGTDLLLRRSEVPLAGARQWTELARGHWAKLDLDGEDLATRALWAELELAAVAADYEALLDAELPAAQSFVVEEWRRDSGVATWEREYARQVARVDEYEAGIVAWFASTIECTRIQLDHHRELSWIDARSSGVVLLRSARMLLALAELLDAVDQREQVRILGERPDQSRIKVGERQSEPIHEQARQYLTLCLEHSRATLDGAIERACVATLARIDADIQPLIEFTGQPRASSTVTGYGVISSPE